jgi:hypothetical protein
MAGLLAPGPTLAMAEELRKQIGANEWVISPVLLD